MTRRAMVVLGVLLAILGLLAATGLVSRPVTTNLLDPGVSGFSITEDKPFPLWLSAAAIAAGTIVTVAALVRRRR